LAGGSYHDLRNSNLADLEDHEDHHAYHRLYWAVRYAQAAVLGHRSAEEGLCRDLKTWLKQDWSSDLHIAYAYTTSERIASLTETLFWIRHGQLQEAEELIVSLKQIVFRDAVHLSENIEDRLGPHNHLLNNARALYLASRVLQSEPEANAWAKQAFDLWDDYFPKLVMEDGSFTEATSFYLVMNCRTVLEYLLACRQQKKAVSPQLQERLELFVGLGNRLMRKDGTLPRFGNSSPDHTANDLWGIFSAAHHHGFLREAPRHRVVNLLTTYYCGGALQYRDPAEPIFNRLYSSGGWFFSKSPSIDAELVVHADPRSRTDIHGDCGKGSFELWWDGLVIIRDPGNVSYSTAGRHWYKSGAAQNVTCINGLAPGISGEYQRKLPVWYTEVQEGDWQEDEPGTFLFCARGLSRIGQPTKVSRHWKWETPYRLVMEEEIDCEQRAKLTSFLHLGSAPWKQLATRRFMLQLPPTGNSEVRSVSMVLDAPRAARVEVQSMRYAPEYGVEVGSNALIVKGRIVGITKWRVTWEFK
jgi:hypothetical protein